MPQESEGEMQGERRGALLVIGVLVVSAVLGGIYGPSVRATSTDVNSLQDSVKSFTHVLSVVQKDYAIPVDTDHAIYSGAIPGMLRVLDPHSSFFDPRAYANLREDQRGRYYGVGMTIVPRDNYTYVLSPMPASPAYRAGSGRRSATWDACHGGAEQFRSRRHAEGPQGHCRAHYNEARRLH